MGETERQGKGLSVQEAAGNVCREVALLWDASISPLSLENVCSDGLMDDCLCTQLTALLHSPLFNTVIKPLILLSEGSGMSLIHRNIFHLIIYIIRADFARHLFWCCITWDLVESVINVWIMSVDDPHWWLCVCVCVCCCSIILSEWRLTWVDGVISWHQAASLHGATVCCEVKCDQNASLLTWSKVHRFCTCRLLGSAVTSSTGLLSWAAPCSCVSLAVMGKQ